MKRTISVATLAVAALLVLAAAAVAKGPSQASIEGPGLDHELVLAGGGEGPGSALGDLTVGAGFFPALFGQSPDPLLPGRPSGELGPKYTITYTVPGPSGSEKEISQQLYPYADRGPVTYMPAGQQIFDDAQTTRGGWYAATQSLKDTLIEAGLPPTKPITGRSSTSAAEAWPWIVGGIGGALVLAAASALFVRRQRPAAA